MKNRIKAAVAVGVVGALALAACGGGAASEGGGSGGGSTRLSIVGFAVPKSANDAAQAAYAKTPEGKGVTWKKSYGPSGDQARAVIAGLHADYVHLSLEGDVQKLADDGIVAKDWKDGPNKGIVSRSVVVIAVRKGNPKKIKGWDDIVKGDIKIVTPNPGSSGSARWNILAAYGHVLAQGGSEADAKAYLTKFFEHVAALPGGGRDATTAFTGGTGDVLISYENEAILARQSGEDFDYIVPDQTLLIENPGAVTVGASAKAKGYLDFVLSKAGQTEFVKKGFRPLVEGIDEKVQGANDPSNPFPEPKDLLTIDGDFGGWKAASAKFFDEDKGLVPAIQKATGKS